MSKLLRRLYRVAWIAWSVLVTATLLIAATTFAVLEIRSRRALDPDLITLMAAPAVVAEGILDPFDEAERTLDADRIGVFYATGREPVAEGDDQRFYANRRGRVLRLGVSRVTVGGEELTWDQVQRIAAEKNRDREYSLRVADVREFGVLEQTVTAFDEAEASDAADAEAAFLAAVEQKLSRSRQQDVFVYVHGYKVVFENPLLVATELWHYLGYDGVFLAYAWPSTPNVLAYGSDLETTAFSARNLRILLEFLADRTDAEEIHLLGYSAGTRLVTGALHQLALTNPSATREELLARYRLGDVALVCSDVDREIFGSQLADGAWKLPRRMTVYVSGVDETLGMARMVFQRDRLGQLLPEDRLRPRVARFLREQEVLSLIDVTQAENVGANNGHAYFHKSPWVSSDLLLTLATGRPPGERGLSRNGDSPLWEFPADYVARLRAAAGQ